MSVCGRRQTEAPHHRHRPTRHIQNQTWPSLHPSTPQLFETASLHPSTKYVSTFRMRLEALIALANLRNLDLISLNSFHPTCSPSMLPESKRVPPTLRREVAQRANQLCEYCRCPAEFSADNFTTDHIRPCQIGGATTSENLTWACSRLIVAFTLPGEPITRCLNRSYPGWAMLAAADSDPLGSARTQGS